MLSSIVVILTALVVANAEVNGTSCNVCNDVNVCSMMNTSTICYQANNISYANEFNEFNSLNTNVVAKCNTCITFGYAYFYQNVPEYPLMEEWQAENPLCVLASTTNIPALVTANTLTGWDCNGLQATTNYCDGWTGVSCLNSSAPYPYNNSIGALILSGVGLTGSLPSQIGNMPFLTLFDISNNSLALSIPSAIGGLVNAQAVDLSSNSFTSSLPVEMFNMQQLVNLSVAQNQLVGSIPEQVNLVQFLESFNIASNQITGTVPSQLCSDGFLTFVDVADNNIACYEQCILTVPTFIPGSSTNCYDGLETAQGLALCDLYAATNIGSLVGDGVMGGWECTSAGTPVSEICDWFGVYCGDQNTGAWDDIVALNTTVIELNLGYLGIEGTIPTSIAQLSYLFSMNFAGNSFHGTIPTTLASTTKMMAFTVADNQMNGVIPNFDTWKNLLQFSVASNSFSGTIPEFVTNLVYLQSLLIQNNQIAGTIPPEMCNASSLNTFDFSYNLLTCYANCLISVPHLINEQNISTCNHVEAAPISQSSMILLIIGVACGGTLVIIALLYVFARDKIAWLVGEVHSFMVRITESSESLLDDLDFTSLRPSMVAGYHHHTPGEMSSTHFVNHAAAKDAEEVRHMTSFNEDGQVTGAPVRIPSKKLGALGKNKAERMSQFNENL